MLVKSRPPGDPRSSLHPLAFGPYLHPIFTKTLPLCTLPYDICTWSAEMFKEMLTDNVAPGH